MPDKKKKDARCEYSEEFMKEAAADFRLDLVEFVVEIVVNPCHYGPDVPADKVDGVVI